MWVGGDRCVWGCGRMFFTESDDLINACIRDGSEVRVVWVREVFK